MDDVKRLDAEGYLNRNYDNPVQKDTILVPDGGYAVLRFVADNPGKNNRFDCRLIISSTFLTDGQICCVMT